jgi:hypothetical protein
MISDEQKTKILKEWYHEDFTMMAKQGYTSSCFKSMIEGSRILFRRGTEQLFTFA